MPAVARADLWPDVAGVANGSAALGGGGAASDDDYVWAGNAFSAELSARAQWEPARDHQIQSEYFRPLPCAAAAPPRPRTGLAVCEEEVARVLSLQRNQWVGRIDRQRGIYDVLALGRATVGFVVDTAGKVVAAEDRNASVKHPLWLLGRGDRELHTTGPPGGAEMELARNLSSCAFHATRADLSGNQRQFDGRGLTTHLSQRYRREIFQVDPPADPISNTELFLALLVVVPEAIAIVVVLLQQQRRGNQQRQQRRPRWYWREGSSAVLVAAAGVVALIGVGSLDAQEHAGHSWRAAALRYSRRIVANETEDRLVGTANVNYHGRETTDNETLLLVARTGYRPHLTRRLLVVSTVVYAALTVAVLGKGAVAAWRRQRPRRGPPTEWRRPPAGGSAVEGVARRPASSPAGASPGGCDRHAPSRMMSLQPRGGATRGQTVKGGVGGDGDGVGGGGSGCQPVGGPPAPAPAPASATGGRGLCLSPNPR
ncbi:hypothetical protein I4F81_009324 [Pyropia yezoensis]|uniref:Uncharacterized protein n=1 Tax=Pyropia yezoensis TaxID=2788 RepID=A0ACC3C9G8_PYRYE|nr:hypothetical protein I4F81_009324 [Neopyropia yezoensis]